MFKFCKSVYIRKMVMDFKRFSVLSTSETNPGKVVFISQSTDIFSNLAFEDWLYKNWNFTKRHLLFLWRNSPCVVIGRHQNPYTEANLPYLENAGVPIARRNSGGGTVYHDEGNLNCTFFTPRDRHNRRWNLNLICEAIFKDFGINTSLNSRDDLTVGENLKISGTAAKLGRLSAYHHCTILVSADKTQLKLSLKGDKTIKSKATQSVPAPVGSLCDIVPELSVEEVLESIGRHYLENNLCKSVYRNLSESYRHSDGFTLINPSEDWFPGLDNLKAELQSWKWTYGMTPFFSISQNIFVPFKELSSPCSSATAVVTIEVYHGIIQKVRLERNNLDCSEGFEKELTLFVGLQYSDDTFMDIERKLQFCLDEQPSLAS